MIADQTLGASATTIDFASIAQTYRELRLVALLRTDRAAQANDLALIRLNNDSGANYFWEDANAAAAAAASGSEGIGATSGQLGWAPGATGTANRFSLTVVEIPFYAETNWHKVILAENTEAFTSATAGTTRAISGVTWASTAAVSRVTLLPGLGTNFVAGCRATLYGVT